MPVLQILTLAAFPLLVVAAAAYDAASYTIPNWICLALAGAFPAAALVCGAPASLIGLGLGVGVVTLLLGMGLFAAGWMGGGDVKLFAAVAVWLGWPTVLNLFLVTAVAGGALTVILLILRSRALRPVAAHGPGWFTRLATPGEGVPYGLAIAVGALVAFARSPIVVAVLAR